MKKPHYPTILRNIVYTAVPEYRDARWPSNGQRVSVSLIDKIGVISLGIGLITPGAEAVFDKVGTLTTTKDKIVRELKKHFKIVKVSDVFRGVKDRYCHGFYFTIK